MNLVLLTQSELESTPVRLTDDRARHIRKVLRKAAGESIRIGVLDGPIGTAEVLAIDASGVELFCSLTESVEPTREDTLLLAVPRPIVLRRCLAHAAALGFGRIHLFRSQHVDPNHLAARVLEPERFRDHLIAGLSQSCRTRLPDVELFADFRRFVEDGLDSRAADSTQRFVAHPTAPRDVVELDLEPNAPFTLAIGPERGFTDDELETFAEKGVQPVRAGRHPLRVETALAYITGQLSLLRDRD